MYIHMHMYNIRRRLVVSSYWSSIAVYKHMHRTEHSSVTEFSSVVLSLLSDLWFSCSGAGWPTLVGCCEAPLCPESTGIPQFERR